MKKIMIIVMMMISTSTCLLAAGLAENRQDSLLFVGISTTRNIAATVYPATIGSYLGKYLAIGA